MPTLIPLRFFFTHVYTCVSHLSMHMTIHMSIFMTPQMCFHLSIHMFVHMSMHMSVFMSIHISLHSGPKTTSRRRVATRHKLVVSAPPLLKRRSSRSTHSVNQVIMALGRPWVNRVARVGLAPSSNPMCPAAQWRVCRFWHRAVLTLGRLYLPASLFWAHPPHAGRQIMPVVPEGPHKLYFGGIPSYFTDDQVQGAAAAAAAAAATVCDLSPFDSHHRHHHCHPDRHCHCHNQCHHHTNTITHCNPLSSSS